MDIQQLDQRIPSVNWETLYLDESAVVQALNSLKERTEKLEGEEDQAAKALLLVAAMDQTNTARGINSLDSSTIMPSQGSLVQSPSLQNTFSRPDLTMIDGYAQNALEAQGWRSFIQGGELFWQIPGYPRLIYGGKTSGGDAGEGTGVDGQAGVGNGVTGENSGFGALNSALGVVLGLGLGMVSPALGMAFKATTSLPSPMEGIKNLTKTISGALGLSTDPNVSDVATEGWGQVGPMGYGTETEGHVSDPSTESTTEGVDAGIAGMTGLGEEGMGGVPGADAAADAAADAEGAGGGPGSAGAGGSGPGDAPGPGGESPGGDAPGGDSGDSGGGDGGNGGNGGGDGDGGGGDGGDGGGDSGGDSGSGDAGGDSGGGVGGGP